MRFLRAVAISILGYYVLALAHILIATALQLDILAPSLPVIFWVAATLVTVALTFGLMHWYFRTHEKYGWKQGLLFGLFFVAVSIVLDIAYVFVPGDSDILFSLFASYAQSPGFLIQCLAVIATAVFVGHAHQTHRGKKKRKHG